MTIREKLGESRYQNFIEHCILNEGTNYRLHKALKKDRINMAFLGGSVTMGCQKNEILTENFPKLLTDRFKSKWVDKNITSLNLGIAGVSSSYGLIQTEKYLSIDKPDVVFVEYSVNDGSSLKDIAIYESLIRKLLQQEQEPAVILLTLMTENYNSCSEWMLEIGRNYRLPVIGLQKELSYCIECGDLTWRDYAEDEVHPHSNGHKLISDCLYNGIQKIIEGIPQEKGEIYLNYFSSAPMENLKLVDLKNVDGTFLLKQSKDYGFLLEVDPDSNKHFLQFECDCKGLIVVYEQSSSRSYGSLQVLFDGMEAGILKGYSIFAWNNPVTQILFHKEVSALHSIEFRMLDTDQNKVFRILDIAWF